MMWSITPWWHWLGMVVVWGLLIGGAVWAIGYLFPHSTSTTPSALGLLDQRLARGELDPDEYRQLRELIER